MTYLKKDKFCLILGLKAVSSDTPSAGVFRHELKMPVSAM
jgi:hypothetical protein